VCCLCVCVCVGVVVAARLVACVDWIIVFDLDGKDTFVAGRYPN
jgi:hypothetical protein